MERVVVALGGNALLRRGADDTFEEMYRAARAAAERVADIASDGWEVVLTHGNGPQVGRILIQQEAAAKTVSPMPLDVCGAESQGLIGYLLQVTIGDVFFERGMERPVCHRPHAHPGAPARSRVPQADEVHRALLHGRPGEEARGAARLGDEGGPARRVAPGRARLPPYSIVETPVVKRLVADGVIVIAGGGGGVPVIEKGPRLIGKEGVVDKDLAAAILAAEVGGQHAPDPDRREEGAARVRHLYPEEIERMTADEATGLLKAGSSAPARWVRRSRRRSTSSRPAGSA